MDFDFALLLVVLTAVTGVIWLVDWLFFYPRRRARALELQNTVGGSSDVREQLMPDMVREPIIVEYARSFFPVILLVLGFRSFIAEPFKIPSGSMMPTLLVGDFILVNKFAYGLRLPVLNSKIVSFGEPQRGDVIVFRYPKDPSKAYIKRVIGLPGDEITYHNKTVQVNGQEIAQSDEGIYAGSGDEGHKMSGAKLKIEHLPGVDHQILQIPNIDSHKEGPWTVPQGHYFAMGDNRDNSEDSRFWGFVPEENLIGKAFIIWMNWDQGIDFKRIGTLINRG